jgi:predicted ATPase
MLFVQRAQAVRPETRDGRSDGRRRRAICLALDGLPLAIELAAARTELLSPAAIRSARGPVRPARGRRVDAYQRQQTLRAAIDWSYELLTTEQRTFFARLGVFAGGFELDASLAVAGSGLANPFELLASLVKQSMVVRAGADRYRLLDTLRAYALDVLAHTRRRRHARPPRCVLHRARGVR